MQENKPLPFISSFMYCKDMEKEFTADGQEIDKPIKPLHGLEPSTETGCYSFKIICCFGGLVLGENAFKLQFCSVDEKKILQQTPEIILDMTKKMLKEDDTYQFNFSVKELEIPDGGLCETRVIANGWVIDSFRIMALEETEYIK